MITLNFQSNIDQFSRHMSKVAFQQIPFATAQALNALAVLAKAAEVVNETKVLDRPRPFTTGSIRITKATKKSQEAVVWMMDIAANYLRPYQFGGTNVLNSKALLKPIAAASSLDQYGNLPRNFLRSMRGRSDIFIGTVQTSRGPVDGVWQRATDAGAAKPTRQTVNAKTGKVIVRKVAGFTPMHKGRKLRLLIKFADPHPVRQNLDWFGVAQRTVTRAFNREFGKAMAKAVATARK